MLKREKEISALSIVEFDAWLNGLTAKQKYAYAKKIRRKYNRVGKLSLLGWVFFISLGVYGGLNIFLLVYRLIFSISH